MFKKNVKIFFKYNNSNFSIHLLKKVIKVIYIEYYFHFLFSYLNLLKTFSLKTS